MVNGEKSVLLIPTEENRVTDVTVLEEIEAREAEQARARSSSADLSDGKCYKSFMVMAFKDPLSPIFTLKCDGTASALTFKPYNIKGNNTISYTFYYKLKTTTGYDHSESRSEWYAFGLTSTVLGNTLSSQAEKGYYKFVSSGTQATEFDYEVWQSF